jgi:hypothetical protein
MSAPFKLPLTIYQGATFRKIVTWKAGEPPVGVNLTDCSARMQVREKLESAEVLLSFTTENGRISLGGSNGAVTLQLDSLTTAGLEWRAGVYDLEIEFSNGDVRRLLQGTVKVLPEVTRD